MKQQVQDADMRPSADPQRSREEMQAAYKKQMFARYYITPGSGSIQNFFFFFFVSAPKHILWVLIGIASVRQNSSEYPQDMFQC